jgi:hypothetical protein
MGTRSHGHQRGPIAAVDALDGEEDGGVPPRGLGEGDRDHWGSILEDSKELDVLLADGGGSRQRERPQVLAWERRRLSVFCP